MQLIIDTVTSLLPAHLYSGDPTVVTIAGHTYTITIDYDDCTSQMDDQGKGFWCGQLKWVHGRNDYGYSSRPSGFDGNAEILERDRSSCLWWQPEADCPPNSEVRKQVRDQVLRNLNDGYLGITVEDEDGRSDVLWGIDQPEWNDGSYLREIAADMIVMLNDQAVEHGYTMTDMERWLRSGK